MSFSKKETSLELCSRITVLGNSISIRMLEYLSSAKHPVPGFQSLAIEFLDLCRTLWSIEAGLTEAQQKRSLFPADITQDLDKRFRQINDEFIVLNQMMLKFLENENGKGGFGKKFRMMFADTDTDKIRTTLSKSKEALRVSSAMFRYTFGEVNIGDKIGMGYTGLAAALERTTPGKQSLLIQPPLQPPPSAPLPERPPSARSPMLPSGLSEKNSNTQVHQTRVEDPLPSMPLQDTPHTTWRSPSIRSSERSAHSIRDTVYQRNGVSYGEPAFEEGGVISDDSDRSRTLMEDHLHDMDLNARYSNDAYRKIDSGTASSWSQSQRQPTWRATGGKGALVNAVQQKNHRMLEQLLDGGARADKQVEASMLRTALQNRDPDSVSLLLHYGIDANCYDREGYTPLFIATQLSFLEGAKLLLKQGADPNLSAGPEADTPLCLAAGENKLEIVQLLMKNGGDANFATEEGNTALVRAMNKTASIGLVEALLSTGADPDGKNGEGATALFTAIQANRVDLMTVLLDHGANPNLPAPKHPLWPSTYKPKALQLMLSRGADHKKTPGLMELAASLKKLESVSILINHGVSPNIRKDGVYTPLCSAIRDNSADIVTYLLDNGADPNLKASEYPAFKCITHKRPQFLPQLVAAGADLHTPKGIIETAVSYNDKDAIMYLIDKGVNPNDKSPEGNTALTTAIRENQMELVELLLANGADPTIRGQDWPLCIAVKRPAILRKLLAATPNPRVFRGVVEMAVVANQLESIKLLLKAGVSVEDKNCGVFSPLTTAIREERKDIVRFLLDEANADPNAPGEHLPLVKALRHYHGDTETLVMLLTRGANINKMHRGWNPILQCVENGDVDVLRLLIEKGGPVDLQAVDEQGRPVIDFVTERGWEEGLSLMFPNAQAKHRSLSVSSWRWITSEIAKSYQDKGGDDDRCSRSSATLPEI